MTVAVAIFIRGLIQAAVSTAILVGAEKVLTPLLDKAKAALRSDNNMTDEEATDSIANEVIDTLVTLGLLTFAIRSKIPPRIAEKLGFTSKGWVKRPISAKLPSTAAGSVAKTVSAVEGTKILSQTEASAVIEAAKTGVRGFKNAFKFLEGRLNTVFLAFLVAGNFIDFGNWETGAYSDTFQKIIAAVTFGLLVPNEDYRKTKTTSPEVFTKVYETYKLANAVGIADPFKQQTVNFTRDNLIDVIDQVGAQLLLSTGKASTKEVLEATTLFIIFGENAGKDLPTYQTQQATSTAAQTTSSTTTPRVYTGIISQGVVGKATTFTLRPDDLIESKDELLQAAANNLAPYLTFLLSKVIYEVKIVSSVITKDGFKQTGTLQQVQSGTYADGKPRYKTVANKFAVLDIFVLTDRGTRSKITSLVLGPTNSAKLSLQLSDLRSIEASLPELITTTDTNEITGIETTQPITVSTPKTETTTAAPAVGTTTSDSNAAVSHTTLPTAGAVGATATTLAEWYRLQGIPLPPVATRAVIYAKLGLGNASYYTGTAEQNTKLLAALKMQPAAATLTVSSTNKTASNTATTNKTSSTAATSTAAPKTGKADETGKVVQSWVLKSNGDYFVTYKDGSTRTIKA